MAPKSGTSLSYVEMVMAVDLPTAVCRELTEAALALRKAVNPLQATFFWVPPTVAHVAVLATGRVREDLVGTVTDVVAEELRKTEPFEVRAKNTLLYEEGPDESRELKAIWVMVEPAEKLLDLRKRLRTALADLDLYVDSGEATPHIPLALADEFRNSREFTAAFVDWQTHDYGAIPVREVVVKSIAPQRGEAERPFPVLASLPLGAGEGQS